jgi:hypothetical protein
MPNYKALPRTLVDPSWASKELSAQDAASKAAKRAEGAFLVESERYAHDASHENTITVSVPLPHGGNDEPPYWTVEVVVDTGVSYRWFRQFFHGFDDARAYHEDMASIVIRKGE